MRGWGGEGVSGTHRFDHGRGDVKNNERGRGQERGCNLPFPLCASLLSVFYLCHLTQTCLNFPLGGAFLESKSKNHEWFSFYINFSTTLSLFSLGRNFLTGGYRPSGYFGILLFFIFRHISRGNSGISNSGASRADGFLLLRLRSFRSFLKKFSWKGFMIRLLIRCYCCCCLLL